MEEHREKHHFPTIHRARFVSSESIYCAYLNRKVIMAVA